MCMKINKIGKQEVGIWWVQKRFPPYGVSIWSLWPNIRFLPSIVAEKNVTKNVHICSMCIKTNQVGKQEVGNWRIQKRYPQYGIPIWRLWPNIRFLPSTVTDKNATKNILDGRKDRRTEVKQYTSPPPSGSGGINMNKIQQKSNDWLRTQGLGTDGRTYTGIPVYPPLCEWVYNKLEAHLVKKIYWMLHILASVKYWFKHFEIP
jgi:hypothetical protein